MTGSVITHPDFDREQRILKHSDYFLVMGETLKTLRAWWDLEVEDFKTYLREGCIEYVQARDAGNGKIIDVCMGGYNGCPYASGVYAFRGCGENQNPTHVDFAEGAVAVTCRINNAPFLTRLLQPPEFKYR